MQIVINFDTRSPQNCMRKCENILSHFQMATIFDVLGFIKTAKIYHLYSNFQKWVKTANYLQPYMRGLKLLSQNFFI